MTDEEFKPSFDVLAGLLDREEADRHADAIANDPEIRRIRDEIDELERQARAERARQEAERMKLPAPASEKAEHVEAVVVARESPRLTAAKIKLATEIRRLVAPPMVLSDSTDRGRNTVVVRRGGEPESGIALEPGAREAAAGSGGPRVGPLLAVVGALVVGGVIVAVSLVGTDESRAAARVVPPSSEVAKSAISALDAPATPAGSAAASERPAASVEVAPAGSVKPVASSPPTRPVPAKSASVGPAKSGPSAPTVVKPPPPAPASTYHSPFGGPMDLSPPPSRP